MTSTAVHLPRRPRARAALGLLTAATVLVLQVGLSAWRGAALCLAVVVAVFGVLVLEVRLRTSEAGHATLGTGTRR